MERMGGTAPSEEEPEANDLPPQEATGSRLFGRRIQPKSPNEALQPEAAPPPPAAPPRKRRSSLLSVASGGLSLVLVLALVLVLGGYLAERYMRQPGPLQADKVVTLAEGNVWQTVSQLETEGVIESPVLLYLALLLENKSSKVKAGEYLFHQNISLQGAMDTLVEGRQVPHKITIPEGLTSEQIVQRLRDNEILVGDIVDTPKEGSLMPDTYNFVRGDSRERIIQQMQRAQRKIVDEVWAHRSPDIPFRTPYEMVTLASIVEKETGRADERTRVAGVFINRLSRRMRLQSDPTIVYGLVGGKGTLGRGIQRAEIDKPTPYNTYVVEGLPPGPICNPGRAAMEAVANPSRTKDLYFVADGTGGHAFAETLDQHGKNVSRWRQIEKDAKDRVGPDADKLAIPTPTVPGPSPAVPGQKSELAPDSDSVFGALAPTVAAGAATPAAASAIAAIRALIPSEHRPAEAEAAATAFGPASDPPAKVETYPVSPSRLADQKARAAQFGLSLGKERSGKRKSLETADPTQLRPRDYDLNAAKTIPPLH
jgi:UPF0755 protein